MGILALPLVTASGEPGTGVATRTNSEAEGCSRGDIVSVHNFGAKGDGETDDTAAFQRAVDHLAAQGGGILKIPPGRFKITTIRYPVDPVTIHTIGSGFSATILEMAAVDQPIIQIDPASPGKRMSGARFADFGIAAHASGRADKVDQIAVNAEGFNAVIFERIAFRGNVRGSVGTLFYTASHRRATYQQTFRDIFVSENVGPGYVLRTGNGGNPISNSNIISVEGFWVYANTGMITAFDMTKCTLYTLRNGLIESSAQTGIELGNSGLIESIWFEDIAGAPLRFAHARGIPGASGNTLRNLYLSGFGGTIDIPASSNNNRLENVTGGQFKLNRADPTMGNISSNSASFGDKPNIRQFAGTVGPVKEVTGTRVSGLDGHWQMLYTFKPSAAGSYGFRLIPPAGYRISKLFVTAMDGANGIAYPCAVGWPVHEFFITTPNANAVVVVAQLSYE